MWSHSKFQISIFANRDCHLDSRRMCTRTKMLSSVDVLKHNWHIEQKRQNIHAKSLETWPYWCAVEKSCPSWWSFHLTSQKKHCQLSLVTLLHLEKPGNAKQRWNRNMLMWNKQKLHWVDAFRRTLNLYANSHAPKWSSDLLHANNSVSNVIRTTTMLKSIRQNENRSTELQYTHKLLAPSTTNDDVGHLQTKISQNAIHDTCPILQNYFVGFKRTQSNKQQQTQALRWCLT